MKPLRLFGTALVLGSVLTGLTVFHPGVVRSTDLQDSTSLVAHPAADINDVYIFPSQVDPKNVVLVMDVNPAISSGSTGVGFDPNVLYQFKIAHTATPISVTNPSSPAAAPLEDTVIQFLPTTAGTGQTLTMFGPAAPNQTGSVSTVIATTTAAGSGISFGKSATFTIADDASSSTLKYPVRIFAGLVTDRSFFDLAKFYRIYPDRDPQNHLTGQSPNTPGPTVTSFAGTKNTACDTASAPVDYFGTKNLKTLAIVVELPRALLKQIAGQPASSAKPFVHIWATTSTVSGV